MLLRIAIVAALMAGGLVYVQKQDVLQHAGLLGYCHHVATPIGETGAWHECLPGKLSGKTGLTLASCTRQQISDAGDLWRCPTELASDRTRQ